MRRLTSVLELDLSNKQEMYVGRYCSLIKAAFVGKYVSGLHDIVPECENLTLKVFKEGTWGTNGVSIAECSAVQNVFAYAGFAPRVYDLVQVFDSRTFYTAQITEEVMGEQKEDKEEMETMWRKMLDYGEEVHLGLHLDTLKGNMVGDKWVDFQGFRFKPEYGEALKKELKEKTQWKSDSSYQHIPELAPDGVRKESRVEKANMDFKDTTVLDVGCSAGYESVIASRMGAKRVYAVDLPEVADVARKLTNYLHAFNVEVYGYDDLKNEDFLGWIRRKTRREYFDRILFLSMRMHIGFPDYLKKLMGRWLLFEGHRELDDKDYQAEFKERQLTHKIIGATHDLGARHLYAVKQYHI